MPVHIVAELTMLVHTYCSSIHHICFKPNEDVFKVAGNPVFSRSTNLESKLIEFFVFVNF